MTFSGDSSLSDGGEGGEEVESSPTSSFATEKSCLVVAFGPIGTVDIGDQGTKPENDVGKRIQDFVSSLEVLVLVLLVIGYW